MKPEPFVSLIINNYNYARFLRGAIDSALCQTYRQTEVIVVDDGSSDHSRQIILGYGDRVTPIFKVNGGQASALNAGFARSRGEIVIFLDADDILLTQAARQAATAFLREPDAARVQYRMEVIDAAGRTTGARKPAPHLPLLSGDLRRHVLSFPFDIAWLPTSGNAFSARVLQQVFPIPEQDFRILADFYLSHLTPLFGPVVSLDTVCAYYRVHGSNNYEPSHASLDLERVRSTIRYWRTTQHYLMKFSDKLGLKDRPTRADQILSVSYVANRLVSLKLEPHRHPIQGETVLGLFALGARASFRRFDVSIPMKGLFLLWFLAASLAPRALVHWLADIFLFPERRRQFNKVLRFFHLAS